MSSGKDENISRQINMNVSKDPWSVKDVDRMKTKIHEVRTISLTMDNGEP